MLSYFESRNSAERYARSRPYFHPLVVKKIRDFLKLHEPVPWALDVACGTGQSTLALKEVASQVVGTDTSREMLVQAPREAGVQYVEASAEDLPFADDSFRLVTVALVLHWFERSRFLTEASWVLNPGGWLIIYDNGFFGEMKENPEHERWYREDYLARYPSPPRNKERLTEDECRKHGLRLVERERYTHEVSFLCRGAHQLPYDPEQRGRGHRERSRKLRKRAHVANKFLSPYVQEATRHLSVW